MISATKKSTAPPISHITGDGPRRVLLSEGPKLISLANSSHAVPADQAKATLAVNGPRRIAVNTVVGAADKPTAAAIKPVVPSQSSTGLRQPVKYSAIGTSSAIPKPVTRMAGSRLPAPAPGPSKSRLGVSTAASVPARGLQGRRAT